MKTVSNIMLLAGIFIGASATKEPENADSMKDTSTEEVSGFIWQRLLQLSLDTTAPGQLPTMSPMNLSPSTLTPSNTPLSTPSYAPSDGIPTTAPGQLPTMSPMTLSPSTLTPSNTPSSTPSYAPSYGIPTLSPSSRSSPSVTPTSVTPFPTIAPNIIPSSAAPTSFTFAPVLPQGLSCDVQLTAQCFTMNSSSISEETILCDDYRPVTNTSECMKNVTFEYIITNECLDNTTCTDMVLNELEVQRDGVSTNLTALVTNLTLPPGDNATVMESTEFDFCTSKVSNTTASILATTFSPPSNVARCASETTYELVTSSIPSPLVTSSAGSVSRMGRLDFLSCTSWYSWSVTSVIWSMMGAVACLAFM